MEQRVLNQRTVKVMGENGMESFTTVVLDSLHYESYLICTNCGPLGLKGENSEPSTNRTALTDRTWAHIVHSAEDDDETGNVEFDFHTLSDEVKQQVNRYRVCSCLVAYVLIFIKHIPSCRPNLTYANMLTNKWYDMLWNEYNLQKPSKRKRIKLRMLLELFATESAVFEKFMLRESGVDFADMRPDEKGNLSPFCIEQLTDVVRSLQRCVDLEVINTAWSHSLDHSPMTSSHRFQMMTELAGLHGSELDYRKVEGPEGPLVDPAPHKNHQGRNLPIDPEAAARNAESHARWLASQPVPPASAELPQFAETDAPRTQGRPAEQDDDSDDLLINAAFDEHEAPGPAMPVPGPGPPGAASNSAANSDGAQALMAIVNGQRGTDAPATEANLSAGTNLLPPQQAQPPQPPRPTQPTQPPPAAAAVRLTPEQQAQWDNRNNGPSVSAKAPNGRDVNTTVTFIPMMDRPVSRKECGERADVLAARRQMLCEMQQRLTQKRMPQQHSMGQKQQLIKLFTDRIEGEKKEPMLKVASTGKWMSAVRAAELCMPDLQDALNSGIAPQALKDWIQGNPTDTKDLGDHSTTGQNGQSTWEYKVRGGADNIHKMPADYDFNWATLKSFSASSGDAPPAMATKQKSVWSNSAREIMKLTKGGSSKYSLMKAKSMTTESMRDTLFQMSQGLGENKVHIPRYSSANRSRLNDESCMLSGAETFKDPTKPPALVHPPCQKVKDGDRVVPDPHFQAAKGPNERLAHLIDKRALASCILPESFERGVPIMECESSNGIYVNKYVASQHAALVVESSNYLMKVPGVASGNSAEVPDSFQVPKKDYEHGGAADVEMELEQARSEVEAEGAKRKADDNASGAPPAKRSRGDGNGEESEPEPELGEEAVEDQDEDFVESDHDEDATPEPSESGTRANLDAVEKSVSRPESEDFDAQPKPGAFDKAAGASADPSAKLETLPMLWDQGSMFFSMKMIDTLHNDCDAYVDTVRAKFTNVYGDEDREETLQRLPHIAIRFPGTVERDKNMLMPLSRPVPLKESSYCDVAKQVQNSRASKGLTEAVQSFAHGRAVAFNDPEVLEFEAEARGVNSGFDMRGNLFARSTWQRFTLSALDARGMRTPEEEARVNDQGLCMSHRVRNHLAASAERVRGVDFGASTLATQITFAAQERELRQRAQDVEEERVVQSASARIHACEAETNNEVMEDSLNETFVA